MPEEQTEHRNPDSDPAPTPLSIRIALVLSPTSLACYLTSSNGIANFLLWLWRTSVKAARLLGI
jgi:hypothetical protein